MRDARSDRNLRDSGTLFDYFNQTPALELGERPGFFDADAVADFGFALFVVRVKLFVTGDDLLVPRMRKTALDADRDRLGHLVGNDLADAFFAFAPGGGVRGGGGRRGG